MGQIDANAPAPPANAGIRFADRAPPAAQSEGADRVTVGSKRIRGLMFNLVSLLALAVSYTTFLVLSLLLPRVAPVWLQGLAIVPAVLVNYLLNSYWTFRESGRA